MAPFRTLIECVTNNLRSMRLVTDQDLHLELFFLLVTSLAAFDYPIIGPSPYTPGLLLQSEKSQHAELLNLDVDADLFPVSE